MTEITIRQLTPELIEDYFDFFDNRAFSDDSPYYPCYCNAFNLSLEQLQKDVFDKVPKYGEGKEAVRKALRASAWQMVQNGLIQGYLAYDNEIAVGWCNANDRLNYFRVGEFDIDDAPVDSEPTDCPEKGYIKSIVCFEISPEYRGQGIRMPRQTDIPLLKSILMTSPKTAACHLQDHISCMTVPGLRSTLVTEKR